MRLKNRLALTAGYRVHFCSLNKNTLAKKSIFYNYDEIVESLKNILFAVFAHYKKDVQCMKLYYVGLQNYVFLTQCYIILCSDWQTCA